MRIKDQLKPNWGGIYWQHFGRKFNWFGPKNGVQWFGEPRCKLGSKVVLPLFFTIFHYFSLFSLFFKVFFFTCCWSWNYAQMEDISWMEEDIVESTPTIPFLNTFSVGMVGFVDPHKVVVWRSAFQILGNAQNECVSEVRT